MIARLEAGRIFTIAAVALAVVFAQSARAEARSYDAANVARLSQIVDEAYVLGAGDIDWSYAEPNLTLEKGDLLRTDETGMAEIQFDTKLLIRIGENTHAALVEMGKEKVVGVDSGSVYLRVSAALSSTEGFFLTFRGGQVFALGPALARLDVREDGGARLNVFRGAVGLVTKVEQSVSIQAGTGVSIDAEGMTQIVGAEAFTGDNFPIDDFAAWSEQRDIAFSVAARPEQVSAEVVGAEDLYQYGAWTHSDTFNTDVWQPYVVTEWRPYYNGRWVYSSQTDWTWVPVEPWGYATHHYGSWNYDPDYGWVWIPGSTWHAARVNWVTYDDYVGWVPVGYYGYPVVSVYPYYVTDYYAGYVDDYATFSFVVYSSFGHHHGHHHDHHGHHNDDDDHHIGGHGGGGHGGGHGGGNDKTIAQKFDTYKDRRIGKKWLDIWTDSGRGGGGVDDDGTRTIAEKRDTFRKRMTGREWLDSWNERKGAEGRRLTVDGEVMDTAGLKNAKLRFIKNSGDLGVEKSLRKGTLARLKADHGKIVDVAGRPELRKKVARLESDPRRREKIKAGAVKTGLPKKAARDNAKRFDFRGADKMSGKATVERTQARRKLARASASASERGIRATASQWRGDEISKRSRARDASKRRQAVENVRRNRGTSQRSGASSPSFASVQKIRITDTDLREAASQYRRESAGRSALSTRSKKRAVERISPSQSQGARGSNDSIRNKRSKAMNSETGRALRSRSTESRKSRVMKPGRYSEPARSIERYGSSVKTRERSAQPSRDVTRSPSASSYRSNRNAISGAGSVRNSDGYRYSGDSARSGYTRNSRSRMGYGSGFSGSVSQSYTSSPQPSRGGGQAVSGISSGRSSGRSGGGSMARGRPARAAAKVRAARR